MLTRKRKRCDISVGNGLVKNFTKFSTIHYKLILIFENIFRLKVLLKKWLRFRNSVENGAQLHNYSISMLIVKKNAAFYVQGREWWVRMGRRGSTTCTTRTRCWARRPRTSAPGSRPCRSAAPPGHVTSGRLRVFFFSPFFIVKA